MGISGAWCPKTMEILHVIYALLNISKSGLGNPLSTVMGEVIPSGVQSPRLNRLTSPYSVCTPGSIVSAPGQYSSKVGMSKKIMRVGSRPISGSFARIAGQPLNAAAPR